MDKIFSKIILFCALLLTCIALANIKNTDKYTVKFNDSIKNDNSTQINYSPTNTKNVQPNE
ncbi:hypothetical protein AX016_0827 [Cellulophaga sp. RHA19]|uniref:hypothetical protein n=1 Tax=Cellulophaga sp. RHA19 TaxID=1798237 RepID=UPI000CBB7365|nr:hypothetical protein [Cellulophaga sp. RHA19]PKB42659.1 hypothetical protein AX016_0827 [Cellulophaga sp. RHA19]